MIGVAKTDQPRRIGPLSALLAGTLLFLASATAKATAAESEDREAAERYYTTGLLEPDKLASAWLIVRHIDPGGEVAFLEEEAEPPPGATPFDLPGARWSRQGRRTTYQTILEDHELEDPELVRIGQLMGASEFSYWMLEPMSPEGRFDRKMKAFAAEDDVDAAFAFLDQICELGGEVP